MPDEKHLFTSNQQFPVPWRPRMERTGDGVSVLSADGNFVCEAEDLATAERIVAAVNAHETKSRSWYPQLGEYVRVPSFANSKRSLGWRVVTISLEPDGSLWFDLQADWSGACRCRLDELEQITQREGDNRAVSTERCQSAAAVPETSGSYSRSDPSEDARTPAGAGSASPVVSALKAGERTDG